MALMSVDVDRLLQDMLRSTKVAGWPPPCNAYEMSMASILRSRFLAWTVKT
jgi:hypothetical protein